jgi:hypothetical protein
MPAVHHQVPIFNLASLALRKRAKYHPEVPTKFCIQLASPAIRYKHDVGLARQACLIWALRLVHQAFSFACLEVHELVTSMDEYVDVKRLQPTGHCHGIALLISDAHASA